MCTWTPPSSTIRRASAAYSSGVYGIAGHWSRLASDPEIEQVMTTGSSRLTAAPSAGSGKSYFPRCPRKANFSSRGWPYLTIWPRISPAGFFLVWMLTYVLPAFMAFTAAAKFLIPATFLARFLAVSVPLLGSLHVLAQIGMSTGPALPFLPRCTCAARTGPVSFFALSVYLIDLPLEAMVNVAVPVPFELVFGVSDLPLIVACIFVEAASAGTAATTARARTTNRNLRMVDLQRV